MSEKWALRILSTAERMAAVERRADGGLAWLREGVADPGLGPAGGRRVHDRIEHAAIHAPGADRKSVV